MDAPVKALCDTAIRQDGYDRLAYAGAVAQIPELKALARRGSATSALLSDVHASLFKLRPRVLPEDETRSPHRTILTEAMETKEYERLRATTRLDDLASALGTLELGRALALELPEEPPEPDQDAGEDGGAPGAGQSPQASLKGSQDPGDQRRRLRGILDDAASATEEKVEAVRAVIGPGCGVGDGSLGDTMDLAEAVALAKRLASDPKLARIARLAGRLRRIASGKRRERYRKGPDDVVDVELGNDLGSLLPSELQALGTPELEELALLRFAQRRMLQVKREGKERVSRGPLVVLVDESGSMGQYGREEWSKAVTLALLGIAQRERREFAVVGFADCTRVSAWGRNPSQAELLSWLGRECRGGTRFEPPLDAAMRLVEQAREGDRLEKADLILITDADDGGAQCGPEWRRSWATRTEATGAHLYVVYVQSQLDMFDAIADGCARLHTTTDDESVLDLIFGI